MNCPECGYANPSWRSRCEKCDSPLPGTLAHQFRETEAKSQLNLEPPSFVQNLASRYIFGALLFSFVALSMLSVNFVYFLLFLGIAGVMAALGFGLTGMRQWGRNLAILVVSIGLLSSLLSSSVAGMAINGFFLIWLLTNEHRFRD